MQATAIPTGPDGQLVKDPQEEQAVIARARELKDQGGSVRAIARQLSQESHRSRTGATITPTVAHRILGQ
jgi:hypothetical protein